MFSPFIWPLLVVSVRLPADKEDPSERLPNVPDEPVPLLPPNPPVLPKPELPPKPLLLPPELLPNPELLPPYWACAVSAGPATMSTAATIVKRNVDITVPSKRGNAERGAFSL
ncbi:MAG TPA: hypothetical protein VFE24_04090 [Pirellulales bacterium]|nr:hypothetical protein [Pirellulales bacterium]